MTADAPRSPVRPFLGVIVRGLMSVIDAPLRFWQKRPGLNGMAAFFLAPNMLIFGIFVLLPIGINVAYSLTGGSAFFLTNRVYVGTEQYERLLSCPDYLDPPSCVEDGFWI